MTITQVSPAVWYKVAHDQRVLAAATHQKIVHMVKGCGAKTLVQTRKPVSRLMAHTEIYVHTKHTTPSC